MALSASKTWVAGEILYAADLNSEFNNIYTNGESLGWPATTSKILDGQVLVLDDDEDSSLRESSDDVITLKLQNVDLFAWDGDVGSPVNGLTFVATATGSPVQVLVSGDDDRGITFDAKNGEQMLILSAVTDAVNEITIGSAATGNNPTIACTGEADTGITLQNSEGEEILVLDSVATSINEVKISSAAAGGPIITTSGDDPNIDLNLNTKGTGSVVINGGATGTVNLGNAAVAFPNADGSANYVLTTDGAATASFAETKMPRGHLVGINLTRPGINDVTFAVGECRGGTAANQDAVNMTISSALTKYLDDGAGGAGSWVVGNNQSGYSAAGAIAVDTWYHCFVIEDGSGTVDAGFDDDINCTNLLAASSYTNYRRVGSIRTTAADADDWLPFLQFGDECWWTTMPTALDINNPIPNGAGGATYAVMVPPDVSVKAFLRVVQDANQGEFSFQHPSMTGVAPAYAAAPAAHLGNNEGAGSTAGQVEVWTDTSSQIKVYNGAAGNRDLIAVAEGWLDHRGRYT
jgi:hypothetical protein